PTAPLDLGGDDGTDLDFRHRARRGRNRRGTLDPGLARGATAAPRSITCARRDVRRSRRLARDRSARRTGLPARARTRDCALMSAVEATAGASVSATKSFLLQRVQPAMTGLIDGSLS